MKNKSKELDVDFIGGQGPLTKSEEKAISEFFLAQKLSLTNKKTQNAKAPARERVA